MPGKFILKGDVKRDVPALPHAPVWMLLVSALFGGMLTATVVWFWQQDWVFAILLALIGSSFAALLAAAFLLAAKSSFGRALLFLRRQHWSAKNVRRKA